ncbi:hypothetical protein Bca101_056249 [Brassica carinata]
MVVDDDGSQGAVHVSHGEASVPFSVSGGSKGSWVGAVQGNRCLKKYDVEISMKDGVGSILVPEEITKDVEPLWEDFLIGKFLDDAPHIAKIHAIVNKIWALNDKKQMIDVFEVNPTSMKFRVPNQADRNRILRRGMWNLAGIPVVVTKWSPVIEKEKAPVQSIPMWVHLKNVPLNMFSWKGLSFISSPIGTPVRLHPETTQCLDLEVAKIFVRVDLSKDLPKKMNFNIQGQEVLVEYSYPWLPSKCSKCEKWGHSLKTCPRNKNLQREVQKEMEVVVQGDENTSIATDKALDQDQCCVEKQHEELIVTTEETVSILSSTTEPEKVQTSEHNQSESEHSTLVEALVDTELPVHSVQGEDETNKNKEWLDVSPGKSCRTPLTNKELKHGQVAILTNSRFSVLSSEEEGEIIEDGKEEIGTLMLNVSPPALEGTKEKEVVIPRQSLPRDSKLKHKVLGDKSYQKAQDAGHSDLHKKKSRIL